MKKYDVSYQSGEALCEEVTLGCGRTVTYLPYEYCDYMLADIECDGDTIRLYAQVNPNDYGFDEGRNEKWDEHSTYDDLKAMIIEQAKKQNIDPACLKFYLD